MDLRSYNRLLSNQDVLPQGGFGNVIAAPLQGAGAGLRIAMAQLPPAALSTFKHAASMANPKLYEWVVVGESSPGYRTLGFVRRPYRRGLTGRECIARLGA
jgi:hypothetical protein